MSELVIVALISLAGTGLGTFGAIMAANKLTVYRIEQLEKKMDKHNCFIERLTVVETNQQTMHADIQALKGE